MEYGGAVLRLMGDQASFGDLGSIVDAIMYDAGFRESCDVLSRLICDEPLERRQEMCRNTVTSMLCDCTPDLWSGAKDFQPTTPVFAKNCAPLPYGPWEKHVTVSRRLVKASSRSSKMKLDVEFVTVSPYLLERISAIEALWGVRGYLLKT